MRNKEIGSDLSLVQSHALCAAIPMLPPHHFTEPDRTRSSGGAVQGCEQGQCGLSRVVGDSRMRSYH
jgi:hypothetical protein